MASPHSSSIPQDNSQPKNKEDNSKSEHHHCQLPYENLRHVRSPSALRIPIRMAQQTPDLTHCSLMAAKPMQDNTLMCSYGYTGNDA